MSSRRFYRQEASGARLASFNVTVKESDLWIAVSRQSYGHSLSMQVEKVVWNRRRLIETYLEADPLFASSLKPCLPAEYAPGIVREMARAGTRAGVGPMAAVAGAIAEAVGHYLIEFSAEVIVENGGDIFLKVVEPVRVGIYAGHSPLSGKLALQVNPGQTPLGICSSSGTVGPSFSYGRADAAVALSQSTVLADAAATALGNLVQTPADLEKALDLARKIEGLTGALLICGDQIAAWGEIVLQKI